LPEIVAEVASLTAAGFQEVVVTGVQISHYRWQGQGLFELTQALLGETEVPRLRLTSIAPWSVDERLVDLWSDPRLCRHVHLSLQSGSTTTLQRMGRPYGAAGYARAVESLRKRIPGLAVTTDIIAGFPGETEEEFEESLAFAREMAFARIHAFPYSLREGTPAAALPDQVPYEEKRARMAVLLELASESEAAFEDEHLGQEVRVLWEERREGRWQGLSDNYLRVWTDSPGDLRNRLGRARVVGRGQRGLEATPLIQGHAVRPARVALPVQS
jgi:threonylcarbamoyladenosine tRNA methylthiotransferase MtaB